MRNAKLVFLMAGAAASFGATANAGDDVDRSIRAEISADAANRTSLLTGEYESRAGGLVLRQGDSSVAVKGLFQTRYTANIRDAEGSEEGFTHGFSMNNVRLGAQADLNETWSINILGKFDVDGGSFYLLDAWADWELDDNWTMRFGQFKTPFTAEFLQDDGHLMAAGRSLTDSVFGLGRTQGIEGLYKNDNIAFKGSFNDGGGAANTDFNSGGEADFGITGRIEWTFAGNSAQFKDWQGWQGQEAAGYVGGAVHYQDGGSTGVGNTGTTADVSVIAGTIDASYEANGWSVFGAGIFRQTDPAATDSVFDMGFVLQGAVFVSESDELFGRADIIVPDSDTPGGDDAFTTLTFGWNHFFIPESHASKFTVDVAVFLNETTGNGLISSNNDVGLLTSDNSGQFALRGQYSATF